MNGLVKSVRHIQIKQIAYSPKIFQAIIDYETHPTNYDESDDIEYQKQLMNDLLKTNWFMTDRGLKLIRGGRRGSGPNTASWGKETITME
tara:strand:- start:1054 stop:1323 length:270 start_codon:yes stop_codon:yes gene_type:complete